MTLSTKKIDVPEEFEESHESTLEKPNLDGDRLNLVLLTTLYIIQGFPIGLTVAFALILQSNKTVTYEEQAILSMAFWPYFLKIVWAPIIDAFYIRWIGRRKCWLLFLQTLMGLLFLYLAINISDWLPNEGKPDLTILIVVIFFANFLSATLEIVVDGWSLTILKKNNLNYTATCCTLGIQTGMLIGSTGFILLVSEQFIIKYLNMKPGTGGLVTMKSFFFVFGIIVLFNILLIGILKKEKNNSLDKDYIQINVFQNFKVLWDLFNLPRVKIFILALLTMRLGFIVTDNVSEMKLIDVGVSKDDIMIIGLAVYAIKIVAPFFLSKYINSTKPLSHLLNLILIKLFWNAIYAVLLYYTHSIIHKNGVVHVPTYYYFMLGLVIIINEMMNFFMILLLTSFFCRISDPRFGGTYMTLFNAVYFTGFLMTKTLGIQLVSLLTFSKCSINFNNICSASNMKNPCVTSERICEVYIDGYYTGTVICIIVGCIWYGVFKNILKEYQLLKPSYWLVNVEEYNTKEVV
ncbi:acetyl-coenzyme A transporter 1-like [Sipha flava]|uniref:Acetyl-coenzyme A transporter 1-like n=2 Tax=Sipha flava TaxID=143950 RepID=A0A8B8F7Q8_9HEMI|nr:acetyl-coenzyme A transporter 1-like [Sipha flava]